ncbi:MAG: presqualene diphosphate synthase HpnD [Burkholderiaceae bacterium]
MTPNEYCQQKTAASGSSFYYSFLFLKGARREAIMALYAFCREVDDVVDETSDSDVAARQLDWWRQEVARMFKGAPQHPVTRALQPHLATFQIQSKWLSEIIDGMAMDLVQHRYQDYEGLRLYCHRAAGVVGCAAAQIFGATNPQTSEYADQLGLAFQLTNIIRDVGEDARRNRIYLPLEDLEQFDLKPADIIAARHTPAFVAMMKFQTDRARQAYRDAYALLPDADRKAQRPGLMMAAIYSTLLQEIERDGFQVLNQRTSLTPIRKLWLAWRTWMNGRPPSP